MRKLYHTGQFARKAAVSVRTLRYYDQVGLLTPSQHTEAGHRLYSNEDLISLQQILALKFLGLSLEEIKACLQTEPERLQVVLARQKAMMREKRAQLDAILEALEEAEQLLQAEQYDWDDLVKVIQVIQMEQNKDWVKKYFTDEQLRLMNRLYQSAYSEEAHQKLRELHPDPWTEADQRRVDKQYTQLGSELKRLVAIGADPASAEAQAAARLQDELLSGFSKGDPDLEASAKRWWEHFWALPEEQRPIQPPYGQAEAEFLKQALKIYRECL